jgi:glycosyltransferase involved in cell wall biosynthesis
MRSKKNTKPFVTIMTAALNEEKNIKYVIKDCLGIKDIRSEILVVLDDKTTDNTAAVSKKLGARVVQTGKWKGKGAALKFAQKFAKGDYIVQIDSDYQFMPSDIPKLIKPLMNGYDVALGSRYEKGAKIEKGSVTKIRFIGIHFLSLATSIAARQHISDSLAGFKAFRTPVLKAIDFKTDHYGYEAEEVIKAAKLGYKITNIPIQYKKRMDGQSNVIPFKHGFTFLGSIIEAGFGRS